MANQKVSPCVFWLIPWKNVYQLSYEITNNCNLQCKHCCNNSWLNKHIWVSFIKSKTFVDDLADNNVKFMYISWGEPLLYPRISEFLEYVFNKGIWIWLATNATPDLTNFLPILKKTVIGGVFVSLDHYKEKKHDDFRGIPWVFRKTVNGISQMVAAKIPVRISVNIWKGNQNDIEEIIKFVRSLWVFRVHFSMLIKVWRSKDNNSIFIPKKSHKNIIENVEKLRKKYEKKWFIVSIRRDLPLHKWCDICRAWKKIIHASSEQKIYPCSWLSKTDINPSLWKQRKKKGDMKKILLEMNKFQDTVNKRIDLFWYSWCPAIWYINEWNILWKDNLNELLT